MTAVSARRYRTRPHPPGIRYQLLEPLAVNLFQPQQDQWPRLVARCGEELVGLAHDERMLLCFVADEQHCDVSADHSRPAGSPLRERPDEALVCDAEVEAG